MSIDELKAKYFVQAGDATPPSEPVPLTFQDCEITPLVDCAAYNAELDSALATVGTGPSESANATHFIFIANWWLGLRGGEFRGVPGILDSLGPQVVASSSYVLDPPAGTKVLIDILKAKAQSGVDVRVLGWVSFAVMDSNIAQHSGAGSIARVNAMTLESIKDLRAEPKLANKCVLNVIGHTAGAVHTKIVVIGNDTSAVGFTGGIDLEMQRFARPGHPAGEPWHDVVAKVEGPAVQAIYDLFKAMWHENVSRAVRRFKYEGENVPSFVPGTPVLAARALTLAATGTQHHVQSLRTVPQFNYKWYNCLPENDPASFAPQGVFEYKLALRKGMQAAESYIYMEDQSYWSQDILKWANDALKNHPSVKVILLFSGGADPNDAPIDDKPNLSQSINHGLLDGLTTAQRDRVRLFRRFGDPAPVLDNLGNPIAVDVVTVADDGPLNALVTLGVNAAEDILADSVHGDRLRLDPVPNPSGLHFDVVGNPTIVKGSPVIWRVKKDGIIAPSPGPHQISQAREPVIVHAKTVLIDDNWAVIGSGNCMRRSLYTDVEHGVSFIDQAGALVADYRCQLWADHFNHPTPSDFAVLDGALFAWEQTWGSPGAAPPLPIWLEPIQIPIVEVAFTDDQRTRYDKYMDLDSREDWGGMCP